MNWLALDIGGANIKVADGREYARSYSYPLWKNPAGLADAVRQAMGAAPIEERTQLAVTMTGELADCFPSKAAGVRYIVAAVREAAGGLPVRVYLTDGRFVEPSEAIDRPMLAAASNWHALAAFAGRYVPEAAALLIDVGSTTCDVIPLLQGRVVAQGKTDTDRLLTGELVYTGVERSPVCAIASHIPYRGHSCPLVQEVFAHARDVYLITGDIAADPSDCETSDGRPATKGAAMLRLARMVAADAEQFTEEDALIAANAISEVQASLLAQAIDKVASRMPDKPKAVVLSGHGEFLARAALAKLGWRPALVSLTAELGPVVSRCAPAHGLAVLAREGWER